MAVQNRAALKTDKDTAFADNTAGDISAADLRGEFEDVIDSVYIPGDDNSGDTQLMTAAEKTKLSGIATSATANPNALDNVSEDTTPQLGGNLDVNGNSIVSTANGDIQLTPNGTGNIVLGNFTLNADQTVGVGEDNYVLTYDHSSGTWGAEVSPGSISVTKVGTPINNQLGVWTGDGTIEGDSNLVWDGSTLTVTGDIDLNGTVLSATALSDPGGDRGIGWDDSAASGSETKFWSAGYGLAFDSSFNLNVDNSVTTDATTARTLALTDIQDIILMSSASANTVTIPANASVAVPVGSIITIVSTGSGTTTIAGDTGVTLQGNGGSASAGSCDIQTQYGAAALIKIATDTWIVSGDIDAVA